MSGEGGALLLWPPLLGGGEGEQVVDRPTPRSSPLLFGLEGGGGRIYRSSQLKVLPGQRLARY